MILPEIISKEPFACRQLGYGDDQWRDIVDFAVLAMVAAEDMGISSKNVDEMLKRSNPDVKRFLGATPEKRAKPWASMKEWAYNRAKKVGNYA